MLQCIDLVRLGLAAVAVAIAVARDELLLEAEPEHLVRLPGGQVAVQERVRLLGRSSDERDDDVLRVHSADLLNDGQ